MNKSDTAVRSNRAKTLIERLNGRPLVLVGMMGAGKTTVGRRLATRLGWRFLDSDEEIEKAAQMTIPEIFAQRGEPEFRTGETRVIQRLLKETDLVLATGGGAVLSPANRHMLKERGLVVYLRARPSDLYARTRHDRNRPLLQTDDPLGTIERLLAVRDPLYREVAHLTVDTGQMPVHHLVNRIVPMLRTYSREPELLCRK